MVAEGQPLALPQLTEPSTGLVVLLGCATDDRPVESSRAARVYRILARTEGVILRTGTSSATLNAEWDTPPAGIKRRDGRLNYYTTDLYAPSWGEMDGQQLCIYFQE